VRLSVTDEKKGKLARAGLSRCANRKAREVILRLLVHHFEDELRFHSALVLFPAFLILRANRSSAICDMRKAVASYSSPPPFG
jgi:hypothetical protein